MFDNFIIKDDSDDLLTEDRRDYQRHLWEYGLNSGAEAEKLNDDLNDDQRSDSLIAEEDESEDKTWIGQLSQG